MATGSDAAEAAREIGRLTLSSVVEGVATGIIEVGAATPVVSPLCVALLKAKGIVDGASRNKEELKELVERCGLITEQVIDKAKASNTSTIDVSPLVKCVDKLNEVAKRCEGKGCFVRMARFRKDADDIQKLRTSIEAVVPVMVLAGLLNNEEKIDRFLAVTQPRPELAPVPKNVPRTKSSHVVRDAVEDQVCRILGGDEPAVVALTGRSGAGKTTSAAAMVAEREGAVHRRDSETEDQARSRQNRLRALFPDGVVWLRVGKGEGGADRLPPLMLKLAKALHEDVTQMCDRGPELGEDGVRYVKKIVEQRSLRCLVVADDVWESEVVDVLRKTGMWVLLTTRTESMVGPEHSVVVDKLTQAEAETVLRGAAELPRGERLCNDAMKVLEICKHVAMDIAFVGSWTPVRTANGVPKTHKAWARVVGEIEAQIDHVKNQVQDGNADEMGDLDIKRLAVLRAGFKYLGSQDSLAQEMYVALAVFPDGHSFRGSDAAVLLDDEEDAVGPISILERWGVLRAETSGRYRLHDAHVEFAREELIRWESVRKPAVDRWTPHISLLDVAISVDVITLLNMWRALEQVGGQGWFEARAYDDQLTSMAVTDPSKFLAVHVVALLYGHDFKLGELDGIMKGVLEQCAAQGKKNCCPEVQMAALFYIRNSLSWQGRLRESRDVERRLGEMTGPDLELPLPNEGAGELLMAETFNMYGECAKAAKRYNDAETWFRRAIQVQESLGGTGSYHMFLAVFGLGICMRDAGRPGEAEEWLKRALDIMQTQKGPNHLLTVGPLHDLGVCVREAGRPGEAEELLKRSLEIKETKLGADDVQVAYTLHQLGVCVREAGRPREAEELLKRALKIVEAKRGVDDLQVAVMLHELGYCVREAGRSREANELLKRAREINETNLGGNNVQD